MVSPALIHRSLSRRGWAVQLSILLVASFLVAWGTQSGHAAAPIPAKPIYTNKPRFRIPFRYDPNELQRMSASQVQLLVSDDQGLRWRKSQTVNPEEGRFSFIAPADGEYWFSVRTLGADGSAANGDSRIEPGLKVIVDTTPPQIQLALRQSRPGWVLLTWNTVEENFDSTKLRMLYKQGSDARWKALSIVPTADGQTQWAIPEGGNVAVQATLEDLAHNAGSAKVQTSVRPSAETVPNPNVPDFNQPVAKNPAESINNGGMRIPPQFPTSPDQKQTEFKPVEPLTAPNKFSQQQPPTAQTPNQGGFVSNSNPIGDRWKTDSQPQSTQPSQSRDVPFRYVNSYEFNIGYKIDDIGPSGVSAVEVFITQDNGDSWWKYGSDNDRKSPVRVKVPKEGRYGLAMRVRSGVGLATDPPQAGEQPDIEVVVDTTAPNLRLLPLEQGQGVANNQILIQWDLSDANLGEEPITLFYGGTTNGPWHPIAGAHRNTGRYMWTVGQGVPSKLFIRIQAQDAAGNRHAVATDYPVLVDLSRPRARIVDIEPESTRRPR